MPALGPRNCHHILASGFAKGETVVAFVFDPGGASRWERISKRLRTQNITSYELLFFYHEWRNPSIREKISRLPLADLSLAL